MKIGRDGESDRECVGEPERENKRNGEKMREKRIESGREEEREKYSVMVMKYK